MILGYIGISYPISVFLIAAFREELEWDDEYWAAIIFSPIILPLAITYYLGREIRKKKGGDNGVRNA